MNPENRRTSRLRSVGYRLQGVWGEAKPRPRDASVLTAVIGQEMRRGEALPAFLLAHGNRPPIVSRFQDFTVLHFTVKVDFIY